MKKPLIGVAGGYLEKNGEAVYRTNADYLKAILRAGGLPVILPLGELGALDRVDALLLTGGRDVDPRRYGQRKHRRTALLPRERELSDLSLCRAAIERDLPLLAICLGVQELNVVRGGSLYQHLGDLDGVNPAHRKGKGRHSVAVGGRLRDILGAGRAAVNSFHHQAISDLGAGLVRTATADDGIAEAVELPGKRFAVGVQWHPERMGDDARQRRLFAAFVGAARGKA